MTDDAEPVDPGRSWDNRTRAESFGATAESYDAVRPHYPDEIVDAIIAGRPTRPPAGNQLELLDVGTGTGILARALQARGAAVTGSEIDAGMAAVARRRGLDDVHVGRFEDLPDVLPELVGRFDRITSAQAWHWINPIAGEAAARRLLARGGQLWLVWNFGALVEPTRTAFDAVYADYPALSRFSTARGGGEHAAEHSVSTFAAQSGVSVDVITHDWRRVYPRDDYVRMLTTHSDHATLPADDLARLLANLATAIDAHGGEVPIDYTTHAVVIDGLA